MKIRKLTVQATEDLTTTEIQTTDPQIDQTQEIIVAPSESQEKYTDVINYVQSAISALSLCAKDDEIAQDALANLGVVLFELKG